MAGTCGKVEGIQDLNSVRLMSVLLILIVLLLSNIPPYSPTWNPPSGALRACPDQVFCLTYTLTLNNLTWLIHSQLLIIFSFYIIFCFLAKSSITTFSKRAYPTSVSTDFFHTIHLFPSYNLQ